MMADRSHPTSRDEQIRQEAEALWRELYGHAPPANLQGAELLDHLINRIEPQGYARLNSPYLRGPNFTWPARP